jgi:hypothetical protein
MKAGRLNPSLPHCNQTRIPARRRIHRHDLPRQKPRQILGPARQAKNCTKLINMVIDCAAVGSLLFFTSTPKRQSAQKVLFSQGALVSIFPNAKCSFCNLIPSTAGEEFDELDADFWRDPKTGRVERVEKAWRKATAAKSTDFQTLKPSVVCFPA